jgi:hypothetical protein
MIAVLSLEMDLQAFSVSLPYFYDKYNLRNYSINFSQRITSFEDGLSRLDTGREKMRGAISPCHREG